MSDDLSCCRVIFGEADSFPGLTVDRFGDILVAQTLSLGIEQRKSLLFPMLARILREDGQVIRGIYERNDVSIREREGMQQNKGFFPLENLATPESTQTEIVENGIRYLVDFENGQKTGFFLDQKYNRQAVARLSRGKRVLDCFTHTGSFGLNAAMGGAVHVHSVDISETAVEMARENARRNGLLDVMDFEAANVFDLLPSLPCGAKSDYDFGYFRSTCIYKIASNGRACDAWLQRNQPSCDEAPSPRGISRNLFLLTLHDRCTFPGHAPQRGL